MDSGSKKRRFPAMGEDSTDRHESQGHHLASDNELMSVQPGPSAAQSCAATMLRRP